MAEMQHRSKHNAEDEIASPRKRVNGNADPHSRIVRNAKLCVLILLFIILPSCKHGSCKECRSLTGQNDRYKYINTKCNYFHQKFCKFRKYFLPGVVAFEDFRKASSLISASRPQLFIPQQQETCQDAGAAFIGHSASHHVRDLTGNQACSQKPYGNGRVDLAGFQLVITKPLAEPGREYMVFDIPEKKTKVGVQICYDLNFPEISRNETLMGAEVLVKLTMDPQELYKLNEHYHYVRALENQAYLVCTNGTGFFGSHHLYGHSQIISPEGHCIWEAGETPTICAEHIRFHDLRHPYVKHTTKKYFLQKQKSQTTNKW